MEFLARISRLNRIATFFSTAAFGTLPEDRVDFYAADFGKLKSFHPEIELDENGYKNVAKSDIEETYRPSEKKEKETVFKCNWLRIPDTDGRFYRDIVDKRMLGKNQTIQSFRNNQHTIA